VLFVSFVFFVLFRHADVMHVNVLARSDISQRDADGLAVFANTRTGGDVSGRYFMPRGNGRARPHGMRIDVDALAFVQRAHRHRHVVVVV
jgi:hypothetical protein